MFACGAILNIKAFRFGAIPDITIPKFPEHVCLTACVGLSGLPPSGPR